MGARLRCASATICTMRASMVSLPIFSAFMMKLPDALSVPTSEPTSDFSSLRLLKARALAKSSPGSSVCASFSVLLL